jgi:hypothetical protein
VKQPTRPAARPRGAAGSSRSRGPEPLALGFLLGLLVGDGHFGGDGRQPQVTLRMHVRHEGLFRWLERTFPEGRLYGPYHHGGRSYYQWMARGRYLVEQLAPLLAPHLDQLDGYAAARFREMCRRYGIEPTPGSPPQKDRGRP